MKNYFIKQINKGKLIIIIGIIEILFFSKNTKAKVKTETVQKSVDMIAFYWVLFVIGGLIALTLTYVSWRKYKGEKQKQRTHDKTVD